MLSTQLNTFSQQNKIPFGAGKVYLWFDNDGTYIPFSSPIKLNEAFQSPETKNKLQSYFQEIDEFIKSSDGKVELNITTGRKAYEFLKTINNILEKGIKYIMPNIVITGDGSDMYKIPNQKIDPLTKNDIINCPESKTSIIERSNWDNKIVKSTIKEVLTEKGFKIIELEGDLTRNKINKYENENNNKPFAILSERGDIHFTVSIYNSKIFPETMRKKIIEKLESHNMDFKAKMDKRYNRIHIAPEVNSNFVDKSFHIKSLIRKAKEENDLIIVAGDGSNDFSMLDLSNYTSILPINELPLKSIIIDHDKPIKPQSPMLLAQNDKSGKRITVSKPFGLLNGIKTSIAKHALKNEEFANALPKQIKKDIKPLMKKIKKEQKVLNAKHKNNQDISLWKKLLGMLS